MTDSAAVKSVVSDIPDLHFVVNAAGIIRRDDEFELEVFERVLDVNLTGAMRVCTAARRHLARTRGCIVNVASMLSFFGGARVPAYSASKGGVAQLTKSLALAWAAEGIRVNAVAPGWIATPLTEALQQDADRSAQLLSRTAMNRWGRPDEIAGPVLFLCSELASFIDRRGYSYRRRLLGGIKSKREDHADYSLAVASSNSHAGGSRRRAHLGPTGARASGSGP